MFLILTNFSKERINLINKRINGEKEKIFDLKLNIHMREMLMAQKKSIDMHLIGKINLIDSKELIMTKL
jgi:hypothetical protein